MRFPFLRIVAALALAIALSACGGPPVIKESHLLAKDHPKVTSLQFVYQEAGMKTTSTSTGRGAAIADTGFLGFGPLLAANAGGLFAEAGVQVRSATVNVGGQPINANDLAQDERGARVPLLVVHATSGKSTSNRHATLTSYVFLAQLVDLNQPRTIWSATIDTSTWTGQDLVMKQAESTMYDAAYATQFLKALVAQMRRDGAI